MVPESDNKNNDDGEMNGDDLSGGEVGDEDFLICIKEIWLLFFFGSLLCKGSL